MTINKEQFLGDLLGVLTAVWYGFYIITISQLRKKLIFFIYYINIFFIINKPINN